ncbi:MAG: hypothetical protein JWR75_2063 [Devosia sp.]|nr:hypothetical protein [Devosia sp.]
MRLILAAVFTLLTLPSLAQATLEPPPGGYAVSRDLSQLPAPVQETYAALVAAAQSGDMASLGNLFDAQPSQPRVSFGDTEDTVDYLKNESADGDGLETLAILASLLDSEFAALDAGDGSVLYVWPSLAVFDDLSALDATHRVEGIRIMGYQPFLGMAEYGGWLYWRLYLSAEGEVQAFIAGD